MSYITILIRKIYKFIRGQPPCTFIISNHLKFGKEGVRPHCNFSNLKELVLIASSPI
jgi:hypothetical protein